MALPRPLVACLLGHDGEALEHLRGRDPLAALQVDPSQAVQELLVLGLLRERRFEVRARLDGAADVDQEIDARGGESRRRAVRRDARVERAEESIGVFVLEALEQAVAGPPHLVVVRRVGRELDPRLGRPIEDVLISQRGDVEELDPFHEEELGLGLEDDAREPRAERVAVLDVAQLAGGVLDEVIRLLEGGGQGLDDELGELLRDLLGRLRDEPEEEVGAPRRLELAPDAAQGSGPVGRGQEREDRAQPVGVGLAELVEERADCLGLDHLPADLSRQLRKDGDVLGVGLGVLQHASHEVPPQGEARLRVHGAEHRGDALLELVLVGLVLEVEPQPLPRDGQQELRVVRGARPGEEHGHAARLLLLDAAEVDAPEQRAEPVDVAARVEGEGPAHGGLERHPGAGVGAARRAAAEARHQALPRLLRCPAAFHQPATGGEAAPLHAGDERLLDQLLVAGERPEEPPVHPLGSGLVAGGERDPSHDPGARGEARVSGEPGGFGLVARRAIRGRGLARRAQVQLDGADLAGEELRDGRVVGERRQDPLEDPLDRLIELVDVAGEVEGLVVLLVRAALVERLARQEDVEGAPVERQRRGVVAQGLGQLPHLRQESHVRGARGENGLVALEGALDEPGLLEALGGLRLVQLAVGELASEVEGARGRSLVPLLQEGVTQVEVDIRRNELAEPDQAAAEGQLLVAVPITRG